jgi:hypothetical protein
MLLAPRATFLVVLTLALPSEAFAQCTKDADCKGDRVCVNGTCTDPATKPAASPQPVSQEASSSTNPCQIEAPNPGFQMLRADGKLVPLAYHQGSVDRKKGGLIGNAFSYGISKVKSTTLLRIDKEKATVRIQDRQPELLDILTPAGSSPDNIYIVRLTPKDEARYVQIGSSEANAAGSSSSGVLFPEGIRIDMTAETVAGTCMYQGKLRSHYRFKPTTPLKDGEYAFLAGANRMFDFGVDGPR